MENEEIHQEVNRLEREYLIRVIDPMLPLMILSHTVMWEYMEKF